MKNKFEFRVNKGITLLALIITIIVMLILAGVTLSMTFGEDGVIERAHYASEEQRGAAVEEHRDLWKSSLNVDTTTNTSNAQSLEELVEDLKKDLITQEEANQILDKGYVVIGSRTIIFKKYFIGDYVDYEYDEKSEGYELEKEYVYDDAKRKVYQTTGIKWRVLYEKNNKIYIIPYDYETRTDSAFFCRRAYNNLIKILNDTCNNLYSNNDLGLYARSINIKDLENLITDEAKKQKENYKETVILKNYPKVLDYEGYESEEIYKEYNNDKVADSKEFVCTFQYYIEHFFDNVKDVLFKSPYVNSSRSGIGAQAMFVAGRTIYEDSSGWIYLGGISLDCNTGLFYTDASFYTYLNGNPTGVDRDVVTRINVMPIVEIDLSKYNLLDDDNNIETGHKEEGKGWIIEKK